MNAKSSLRRSKIIAWARAHFERTGEWPTIWSGPIPEAPGETWFHVDFALRVGESNLPGGSSLGELVGRAKWRMGVPTPVE